MGRCGSSRGPATWGGPPGERPAFTLTAEDDDPEGGRGVGKSKVVEVLARLAGGYVTLGQDLERTKSDLLAPNAAGKRIVRIDNLKSHRFSWAPLEALITSSSVDGHRLYAGHASVPNLFKVVVTVNGASFSRDMAQRSVLVTLARPDYSVGWSAQVMGFVGEHRDDILADIGWYLTRRRPEAVSGPINRWGCWIGGVLSRVRDPDGLLRHIDACAREIDEDAAETDMARDSIIADLLERGHVPSREQIFIPSAVLAAMVKGLRPPESPTKTLRWVKSLQIEELCRSRTAERRGFRWTGSYAADGPLRPLNSRAGDPPCSVYAAPDDEDE